MSDNFLTLPISDIIIENRYRKDFGDIDTLADNISNLGLLQPIVINEKNELIDGQRRILAYEKLNKKEIPCFKIDLEKIVLGEFSANHYRKDWTVSEMVGIKRAIEPYEKKKAQERQLSGKPVDKLSEGRTLDKIAGFVGTSRFTLKKAEEIVTAAEKEPKKYQSILDEVDNGSKTVNEAYNKIKKQKDKEKKELELHQLELENPELSLPEGFELTHDDFTQVKLESGSSHLIFTDPPYDRESLYLYEELAKKADEVLKDGDSLVFYVGHIILDEVIKIFDKYPRLKYWWTFAVRHSGPSATVHPRNVFAKWKPMLWYVKGEKPKNIFTNIPDLIESTNPDKSTYEWAQSLEEADYIIRYLTIENQTVLDPMMGSGTTGLAALNLNRKFVGIEKDQNVFLIAQKRLENYKRIKNDD